MPQASFTSQLRLKPCLNCGEQIERDSACCWKCGAKRGALQLPKEDDATDKDETRISKGSSLSRQAANDKTGGVVSTSRKFLAGIIQFLIAIPIVLYIAGALLSLLIFFFVIVPIVIPIAIKISYLDYVRSMLRQVGRSPFYISLVSTTFSIGFLLLCGFLVGRRRMSVEFEDVVKGDRITRIFGYLFLPCPKDIRAREQYSYQHRGILILPKREYGWRSEITPLALLTALSTVVFTSMVVKDYFVLKGASQYIPPLVNALGDLVLLWGALIIGIKLGREIIKSKICGDWGAGTFGKANIVGDYLCSSVLGLPSYIVIYLLGVDEVSSDEAHRVYLKYKFMRANKIDLSDWSKTD